MISRIPALEFMQSLPGNYRSADNEVELRVWLCGYGVAIDLRTKAKVQLVGVIGACGTRIECFAHIGLPNVVRFVGDAVTGDSVHLVAEELSIELTLRSEVNGLFVGVSLHQNQKPSYLLHLI